MSIPIATQPRSTDLPVRAVGLLLLALAIAAVSIALNLAVPAVAFLAIQQGILFVAVEAIVLTGLWWSAVRTDLSDRARLGLWLTSALSLTLWLAVVWWLALGTTFQLGGLVPSLSLAIVLPLLVGLPLLLRWRELGRMLSALPASWLIGLQVYRIFGSIFLVIWLRGGLPGIFALPAGAGDVLVGVLALPVAALLQARTTNSRVVAVAWNVLGIIDLADAVLLGTLTTPGRFQLIGQTISGPTPLQLYPLVMIPAFAVPFSILLHAVSLRQLLARSPAP